MTLKSKSNTQIALQKFKTDFWGVLCFWIVVALAITSLFAYFIVPDSSKNANNGDLSLRSQSPGFTVQILQFPDSNTRTWKELWLGKETAKREIAISSFYFEEDRIYYTEFGETSTFAETKSAPLSLFSPLAKDQIVKEKTYLLGTDSQGRDFLSRLIIGSRVSLSIGFIAVLISLVIGISLGALAGYFGGKVDLFILWLINIVWSIPTLLLVIAITLALGKGFWQVFIAVGLTMWVEVARVIRGQVISVKQQQYVTAARALGYSDWRIITKHILPNCMAPVIVISAANFASAILVESGLSFLGLGVQVPVPSWGAMIKENYNYIILGKPYLALLPGFAMFLLVMSFMLIGNALRDALDVKK